MVDDKNLRFKCNVVPTIQILEPPDYFDPYTMITGARVSCGLTLDSPDYPAHTIPIGCSVREVIFISR